MNRDILRSIKIVIWLIPVVLLGIAACGALELDLESTTATDLTIAGPALALETERPSVRTPSGIPPAVTPHTREPQQTPTSVLEGGHLSFTDPALGLSMDIPLWWETRTTPAGETQFLQQEHTGALVPILTIAVLNPGARTLESAFEEMIRGNLGPAIRGAKPVQLGAIDALRVELDAGVDRPPVFWLIVAPSGLAVSLFPGGNPDWIEAMVEVTLDTLRPIDSGALDTPPHAENPPVVPATSRDGLYEALLEPLFIDGEKGWIFASAQVKGRPVTAKLATIDGQMLAAYDVVGRLALDRMGNRLIVDQGEKGVAVLDPKTGATLGTLQLRIVGHANVDPQVDPKTGLVYVFRGRTVFVIAPATATVIRESTLSISSETCGEPGEDADVERSFYDLVNRKLYLAFTTYVCTPWVHQTLVSFDANTLLKPGRYRTELRFQAVPFSDSLFGTTVSRLERYVSWAWNGKEVWFERGIAGTLSTQGIVGDWGRQLIYEAHGQQITIITPYPRAVIGQAKVSALAGGARLVGHDPITDQLFFLRDGQLEVRPTTDILGPLSQLMGDSVP